MTDCGTEYEGICERLEELSILLQFLFSAVSLSLVFFVSFFLFAIVGFFLYSLVVPRR